MHYKKLIIPIKIDLRRCRDSAPIESCNHLCELLDTKSDEPVAQVAKRFALGCAGELTFLKNRPGINPRVHVMNGDANWNMLQQRPLRAAHTPDLRQQAKVHI